MTIDHLQRIGDGTYRLDLTVGNDSRSFRFTVSAHGGIDVVNWEPDFQSVLDDNPGQTEPLLAAVLAFHRAQRCELRLGGARRA